jgi:ParB family transcriptional regulator, chromosome partitioning protein
MRLDLDAPRTDVPSAATPAVVTRLGAQSADPLDSLGDAGPDAAADIARGVPLQLAVADIDEDPLQPRTEFEPNALQELAVSVGDRGVRSPVSVRRHPEQPQRWILNFGARRLRASKMAGKATIPAFVDEWADSYDQVIENEQREGLRPLELALFVQRMMAAGDSQAVIARRMGKGRAYVTLATALIDAPDWMMTAYREGRCRGLRELYELRQLHERLGAQVQAWAGVQAAITRTELAAFKASYQPHEAVVRDNTAQATNATTASEMQGVTATMGLQQSAAAAPATQQPMAISRRVAGVEALVIEADVNGQAVELVLDRLPGDGSMVFVRHGAADIPKAVRIGAVTLRRIVRRV